MRDRVAEARADAPAPVVWEGRYDLLARVAVTLSAQLGGAPVAIDRVDGVRRELEIVALHDPAPASRATAAELCGTREPLAGTVTERVFRTRASVVETYDHAVPLLRTVWHERLDEFGVRGVIAAPVVVDDAVVGCVLAGQRGERPFGPADLAIVGEAAARVAALVGAGAAPSAAEPIAARPRVRESRWCIVRDVALGAALAIAPTALLELADDPSDYRPAAVLLVAVLVSVTLLRVRAAVVTAIVATLASWFVFRPPTWSFVLDSSSVVSLAVFVGGALITLLLAGRLASARRAESDARRLTETLIERAPIGVALFDHGRRFVRVNRKLAEINGRDAAEHLGRRPSEVSAAAGETYEPIVAAVLRTGDALESRELSVATDDGPRHYRASYYPVVDDTGVVLGVGALVEDVTSAATARRRNEALSRLASSWPQRPHAMPSPTRSSTSSRQRSPRVDRVRRPRPPDDHAERIGARLRRRRPRAVGRSADPDRCRASLRAR